MYYDDAGKGGNFKSHFILNDDLSPVMIGPDKIHAAAMKHLNQSMAAHQNGVSGPHYAEELGKNFSSLIN